MNLRGFLSLPGRDRVVAALLAAHLLVIVAMAASPQFHEWIHQDAGHQEHECAVTLFLHGGVDGLGVAVVAVGMLRWVRSEGMKLTGGWVREIALGGQRLGRAPPAVG